MSGNKAMEIEECLELLLENISIQNTMEVKLFDAYGKVCALDVFSGMDVPPSPKSAMDGYAVNSKDICGATKDNPVTLNVIGELLAGDYKEEIVYMKGCAVRIMTGAFIPSDFDCVVRQEDTDYGEEKVQIYTELKPFTNYCNAGEDMKAGELIAPKGTLLKPVHIGLMAEAGIQKVEVYNPVRVGIICTGTELCDVGQPLPKGKIYNNISYILAGAIKASELKVSTMEICVDEEELVSKKLLDALETSDIVITTGAVSVGKKDIIPKVLENIGAKILFRRANIQPGTPTTGSVKDGKIILSLSGNPYAALVNFDIYFWPIVSKMLCNDSFLVKEELLPLASEYKKLNKHRRFLRAKAENGKVYLPSEVHSSSVIFNLTECNCFIDMEPGRTIEPGDLVKVRFIKNSI